MRIQATMNGSTTGGLVRSGDLVELPDKEAQAMIDGKRAIRVTAPRSKPSQKPAKGEKAEDAPTGAADTGDGSQGD